MRIGRPGTFVAGMLAAALIAAGCVSVGGQQQDADVAAATDEEVRGPARSRAEPATVSIVVDGAVSFAWQAEIDDLRIVTVIDVDEPSLRLLSVGLLDFQPLGDPGVRFRAAFDLVGAYRGMPGDFRIPAAGGGPTRDDHPQEIVSSMSNAFLILVDLDDPDGPVERDNVREAREFRQALEPCALEVGEAERSGSLNCPALADRDGETISLRMTWQPHADATAIVGTASCDDPAGPIDVSGEEVVAAKAGADLERVDLEADGESLTVTFEAGQPIPDDAGLDRHGEPDLIQWVVWLQDGDRLLHQVRVALHGTDWEVTFDVHDERYRLETPPEIDGTTMRVRYPLEGLVWLQPEFGWVAVTAYDEPAVQHVCPAAAKASLDADVQLEFPGR